MAATGNEYATLAQVKTAFDDVKNYLENNPGSGSGGSSVSVEMFTNENLRIGMPVSSSRRTFTYAGGNILTVNSIRDVACYKLTDNDAIFALYWWKSKWNSSYMNYPWVKITDTMCDTAEGTGTFTDTTRPILFSNGLDENDTWDWPCLTTDTEYDAAAQFIGRISTGTSGVTTSNPSATAAPVVLTAHLYFEKSGNCRFMFDGRARAYIGKVFVWDHLVIHPIHFY